LLILMLVFICTITHAQSGKGISLSIGPEFSIPLNTTTYNYGSTRDYYQDGIGGNIKVELPITSTLHFTGSAGFIDYPSELKFLATPDVAPGPNGIDYSSNGGLPPYQFIPIKAGLQYYYAKYFYVDAEAGGAIKTNNESLSSFIYDGGLGAIIPVDKHSDISLDVKYGRGIKIVYYPSAMSQISIGVAYKYSF
jgi:hypothetical protein